MKFLKIIIISLFSALPLSAQTSTLINPNQINYNFAGIAVKPSINDNVRYVTAEGSDTNDGRSLGTAFADVYTACESLPGGSSSPPTCGSGEIDIAGTVAAAPASVGVNCGFWLMGTIDPNYANPPTCWLKAVSTTYALTLRCIAPNINPDNGHRASCAEYWGGNSIANSPAFWINGTTIPIDIINIHCLYASTIARLAIDSNGSRNGVGTGAALIEFDGSGGDEGNVPEGISNAALDVGDHAFWLYFHDGVFNTSGNEVFGIITVARSSNVVTVTTSSANDFKAGDQLSLQGVTDQTFNSINGGTYTVVTVSGSPQTVITFNQIGANSSSSGGQVYNGRAATMNFDTAGGDQLDLIYVKDENFVNGGARFTPANSSGRISMENVTEENISMPVLLLTSNGSNAVNARVNQVGGADATVSPGPATVENDGIGSPSSVLQVINVPGVSGPADVIAPYPAGLINQVPSPLREGQTGIMNNHLVGAIDNTQRDFSPTAVRYTNLTVAPGSWVPDPASGTTITTGLTAPDGTTGAVEVSGTTPTQGLLYFYDQPSQTMTLGDIWIGGAWVRSPNAKGYSGSASCPLEFVTGGIAFSGRSVQAIVTGDGQWDWCYQILKITDVVSSPNTMALAATFQNNLPAEIYAPILIHIPAGLISDNEAYALANALNTYDPLCSVGSVCGLNTQKHQFPELTASTKICTDANSNLSTGPCPGAPLNPQTGTTYTILTTDRANRVTFSNAGTIAVTLPQAGSAGFGLNFGFKACDIGAGTATITPTTSTISYTTGSAYTSAASSIALTTGQCAEIYSDNTNYFADRR